MYLQMVNHTVRMKLDEIKRREIERLQELVRAQIRGMSGTDLILNALYGGNMKFLSFSLSFPCGLFTGSKWVYVVEWLPFNKTET